ncbi:hypothetical protein V8B97DRAFT_1919511 [Scleroderma yunnanense]
MTTNTTIAMPTTNTPTEIVVDATNAIKGQLESIKTNKSKDHWEKEWYGILNKMAYINMLGEQAEAGVSSRQDKGKGWEVHPVSETQAKHLTHVPELWGWPAGPSWSHGHSQSHSCSQSHHPCKVIKSTDHVNSNDEVVDASAEGELQAKACAIPHQATYNLKDPPSRTNNIKLTHLPAQQACALCVHRSLLCTISAPQFSCYQCMDMKHGCSNIAQHTGAKQAKSKPWARKQSIPPSPPPPTAASSWWLSNHGTSKSPGPSTEPLNIRLQPLSHKRKGCSSSAGPSCTKVSHEIFDEVIVVTPAWLVKGHPQNVHVFQPWESPSPHPIPALITFNSEDEPPTVNLPLRTSPTISPSLTRLFTLQGDPSSTLFDMSRGPSLPQSTPSVP